MRDHSFVYHTSAAAIVHEFFSDGRPYHMRPSTKLRHVRQAGMWGYTEVPEDPDQECVVHLWHRKDQPLLRVARLVSHELGHLADGGPGPQGIAEETRADEFARVTYETIRLLQELGLIKDEIETSRCLVRAVAEKK